MLMLCIWLKKSECFRGNLFGGRCYMERIDVFKESVVSAGLQHRPLKHVSLPGAESILNLRGASFYTLPYPDTQSINAYMARIYMNALESRKKFQKILKKTVTNLLLYGLINIAVPMVLVWPSLTGGIAILKMRLIGINIYRQ